jgi:N-hydroxyarylamine O-acetyltransferase
VRAGRGGYCFEQNALFLHALRGLGITAGILLARVVWRRPPGTVTPRTHMLLRVELPDGAYLADVGFGGATPTAPVALVPGRVQPTPLGTYRLAALDAELVLELRQDGAWTPLYRFGPEPQHAVDVDLANW